MSTSISHWRLRLGAICFLLGAVIAAGQIANDLPPGTSADQVIRLYGWPTGKVASQEREIWTYLKFQVTLVDGRVQNVSAHPPGASGQSSRPPREIKQSVVQPDAPPVGIIAPATTTPKQSIRPGIVTPSSTPPKARKGQPVNRQSSVESDSLPLRSQPIPPPPRSPVWLWLPLFAATAGAALLWIWRIKKARSQAETIQDLALESPESWEQRIARQLARSSSVKADENAANKQRPSNPQDLTIDLIRSLEWKRFELLTERYFAATGLRAARSTTGPDGGIDIRLYLEQGVHPESLVQCKAWGSELIGVSLVRELRGVMAAESVSKGIFVTTSDFTVEARTFCAANGITTMTALDLLTRFQSLGSEVRLKILSEITEGDYTTPTCPTCDIKLVLREGTKSGRGFWGCRNYPRCRYTMVPRGR